MIKRHLLKEIGELLKYNPSVALLGARQSGKTTLVKQVVGTLKHNAVYLDLESNRDLRKLDDPETFFDNNRDKLVVIDEVQILLSLFRTLRPAIDRKRKPGRFLLLGSASPSLVKGVSETLAGRIAYTELPPLSILETVPRHTRQESLWLRGGFPRSLLARNNSVSMHWRKSFIKSYIQLELSQMFHVELTPATIQNFWQMLAHFNGNIWNAHTFSNSLGVTAPTIRRYLDYMEGAFLIRRLNSWYVNAKKRLVKSPKVFMRDAGLLHAILNIDTLNELYGHPAAGNSWEGFVIEQVVQLLPVYIHPYYYRTHDGAEADLILVKGIKPIASIEIKLSNAPVISRGFFECTADLKTKYNFIITPNSDNYSAKNNITVCSLIKFIQYYLPKIVRK